MTLRLRKILSACLATASVALTASTIGFIWYVQAPVHLSYHLSDLKVTNPMVVNFTRPVQPALHYALSPALAGHWQVVRNPLGVTGLQFKPAQALVPGSSYEIVISHVATLLATKPDVAAQTLLVTAERPADIKSLTPLDSNVSTGVDTPVTVKLTSPNHGLRHLTLSSDAPLKSAEPQSTDDTTFIWNFAQPLQQGTVYHVQLIDARQTSPDRRILLSSSFTTVAEPHIVSATNRTHFYPSDVITIAFDQPMKPSDTIFKFALPGAGKWQDDHTYNFTPAGLAPGTSYAYTVLKGAASTSGGVTNLDHAFSISTPGVVVVIGLSPASSNLPLNTGVSVAFDQPVDHATAQAALSLAPAAGGSFSWSGNTMNYQPTGLGYQTGYSATIQPGVKGIYGLPSVRAFATSFTTTYQILKLGVPYFHQAYALSCEAASLHMALAYRGVSVTELDLVSRFGYNPKPRDTAANFWDNPYQMFVGDINGSEGATGWGVYSPPVAAAAQSYGRQATAITGISASQIAQAIYADNPVVLWGFNGSRVLPDAWNVSGGVVSAPKNEHVRTVYGVAGNISNPVGFYLHDPINGELYWTTAQLNANMSFSGSLPTQGVVIN
jgi:uncharacterized protein YvpB